MTRSERKVPREEGGRFARQAAGAFRRRTACAHQEGFGDGIFPHSREPRTNCPSLGSQAHIQRVTTVDQLYRHILGKGPACFPTTSSPPGVVTRNAAQVLESIDQRNPALPVARAAVVFTTHNSWISLVAGRPAPCR